MRHWGRLLGGYDGETEDEKYWADAINDIVVDCKFCHSFFWSLQRTQGVSWTIVWDWGELQVVHHENN